MFRFGHYEVLETSDGSPLELGRGAMGITYKALDTALQRCVALKVINPDNLAGEAARQRFLREARAAAQLKHPNVASIFHLGEDGGTHFYAMEFIDGETLESLPRLPGRESCSCLTPASPSETRTGSRPRKEHQPGTGASSARRG